MPKPMFDAENLCEVTSWRGVAKDPKTDPGKASRAGHLALVHEGGHYATVEAPRKDNLLVPVYENGRVLKTYTFAEVRANAAKALADGRL